MTDSSSDVSATTVSEQSLDVAAPERDLDLGTSANRRPGVIAAGALLAVAGLLAAGFYAGWQYRNGRDERLAPQIADVIVDRPVVALDSPTVDAGAMPNVVGLSRTQARQVLNDAGIAVEIVSEVGQPYSGSGDTIIGQDPQPGVEQFESVTLNYSQATAVPEMVGADADVARGILADLGVRVETTARYVPGAQEGTVLGSTPVAGEVLPTELTIEVAEAAASVFLADLRVATSVCRINDPVVNGTATNDALVCRPSSDQAQVIEYVLNREIDRFVAVAGIVDRSTTTDPIRFQVAVDGAVVFETTLSYGQTADIDVETGGALRLELRVAYPVPPESCCSVEPAWIDARLLGGEGAVQELFEESNS